MSLLKRSLELGLGALLMTKEAAEELIDELAGQEDDEGKRKLLDELVEKGEKLRDQLGEAIRGEVDQAIERTGLVRRAEYEALLARVEALERHRPADESEAGAGVEPRIVSASDL